MLATWEVRFINAVITIFGQVQVKQGQMGHFKRPFLGLNLRVKLYEFFKSLMGANVPDP